MSGLGVEQLKESSSVSLCRRLAFLGWIIVWESRASKSISILGLGAMVISIGGGRSGGERRHGSCVAKDETNMIKGMEVGSFL